MPADVVLGLQAGDEGKGKVIDYLAKNYDYVVRFNGGNNAGHTLVVNGHRIAVHALPSGILHPHVNNVIGNGCVIDPEQLAKEINEIGPSSLVGRLFISHAAHIIVPDARDQDKTTGQKVGTGASGGPTDLGFVAGAVSGTDQTTYVPTKIEIQITLLPIQTRSQISQQFSLKDFANGNLLRGGFW